MAVKTYSNKSNAKRAAIKAGVNLDNVTFVQNAEGWYWEEIAAPVVEQAVAEAIAEVDTRAEDEALAAVEQPKTVLKISPNVYTDKVEPVEPKQAPAGNGLKIERNREERNGIKRPSVGGKCRQVWDACDAQYNNGKGMIPMPKDIKAWAEANGHNCNNAVIELYQWRKFMGFRGR